FATPSGHSNGRVRAGLGLYTARKAISLLGGELNLLEAPQGAHFVLTHPVRSVASNTLPQGSAAAEDQPDLTEATRWFARRVLLIEDSRLVGELTRTRLQPLFRQVDWAETGPAGLDMWDRGNYDLIRHFQLLPGTPCIAYGSQTS